MHKLLLNMLNKCVSLKGKCDKRWKKKTVEINTSSSSNVVEFQFPLQQRVINVLITSK